MNATCLSYDVEADETIQYVDFTFLYPAVNKYDKYMVGHPEIIVRNLKPISHYFGIAQVDVLPPRHLYLPVLPYRTGGKLMFPLFEAVPTSTFKIKMNASAQIKIEFYMVRFVPQS